MVDSLFKIVLAKRSVYRAAYKLLLEKLELKNI